MKKLSNYFVYAICIIAVAFSAGAFIKVNANTNSMPAAQPVDLTYAAEKALPAVVHIKYLQNSKVQTVEMESDPFDFFDPFGFFGNPGNGGKQKRRIQTPKREGSGSGVIISADGYIVTNNHVVKGADELTVTLDDKREYSARIVGTDEMTDLALIKIDGKDLPAITIGDSNDLKVGEWVLAVGNPFNLNSTVTAGIVSAKARSIGANDVESFIQTDAAINAGNSGGALVNTKGELVGINAMLVSQTGSYAGYGFAIPTTIMNKVVADIKQYGTVQRALIGVSGSDVNKYFDMPGLSWFSFGLNIDGVLTNQPSFQTESATLMAMPEYAPVSHMRMIYMPDYRAPRFVAGGLMPTFDLTTNFFFRTGFYAMYRQTRDYNPFGEEDRPWHYIAEASLVYHTPIGPVSLALTKYDLQDWKNMYLTFNFGYAIFAPKGTFY